MHLCLRKQAVPFAGRVGAVVPRARRSHVTDSAQRCGEEKDTPSVSAALQEEGSSKILPLGVTCLDR